MDHPVAAMGSLNVLNDHAIKSRERRRRLLPALTTKQLFDSSDKDYSRFALSPLTSHAHARNSAAPWTPVTAVPIRSPGLKSQGLRSPILKSPVLRSPVICTPGTPLRTTILERYLAEASDGEDLTDEQFQAPLTLAGAGISDALPTPGVVVNWSLVMGSPPETNSDCFSPVLGTGPAEQAFTDDPRSALSNKSDGEPKSAHSAKSFQSTKSMPARPTEVVLDFSKRSKTEEEKKLSKGTDGKAGSQAQAKANGVAVDPDLHCSPTTTENTFIEEEFGTCEAPMAISSPPKSIWPRRNSFPQFLRKTKQPPKILVTFSTEDKDIPLPPLRSAPLEAPTFGTQMATPALSNNQEEQVKMMTPPPAPTSARFANSLPQVKICIQPSPFSPPPAPTSGSFPVSFPDPVATIDPSPFDPPPAPTISRFREDFPASPIHAGPCPIDTAIPFVQWRTSQEPSSALDSPVLPEARLNAVLASIDPPPAPTQARFSGFFPASPIRSKPAPIDTISPQLPCSENFDATPKVPPPPISEHFDVKTPNVQARNTPPPPSVNGSRVVKSAKVVRFAVVDSPSGKTHFKTPLSPHPWSPRALGGTAYASILSPVEGSFNGVTPPLLDNQKPRMTEILLDGTTSRGRAGQKLKNAGRLTRSLSPKRTMSDEPSSITILPNTVYDPESNQLYRTDSPVVSDKYIILQTYFNPNRTITQC